MKKGYFSKYRDFGLKSVFKAILKLVKKITYIYMLESKEYIKLFQLIKTAELASKEAYYLIKSNAVDLNDDQDEIIKTAFESCVEAKIGN